MNNMLPLLLLLAACDRGDKPLPPTQAEDERLNEAGEMLDHLSNETGPENASAPRPLSSGR
jgi:hypothetical protein